MPKITAIIVSFMRPQYTIDCIKTLHERFPDVKILVGENYERDEDIEKATREAGGKYIICPYDSGNSFVRNRLVEKVRTKYVLVGDDDFWYDENAKIYEMRTFLENTDFDLIGGWAKKPGVAKDKCRGYFIDEYPNYFYIRPADIDRLDIEPKSGLRYIKCEYTSQFFLARTKSMIKWDERLMAVYEHPKFFIDMKNAGRKVALAIDSMVWHKKQGNLNTDKYKSHRWRKGDLKTFLRITGKEYFKMGDKVTKPKDDLGRLKAYYALRCTKINGRMYNRGDRVYIRDGQKLHPDLAEKSIVKRKWSQK